MKKKTLLLWLPALAVVVLDQISKIVLAYNIPKYSSIPVIKGFFNLVHVRNRGMAFGLMNRPGHGFKFYFLVAATVVAIVLLPQPPFGFITRIWRMVLRPRELRA